MPTLPNHTSGRVDVRGPRFAAWVTTRGDLVAALVAVLGQLVRCGRNALRTAQAVVFCDRSRSAVRGDTPTASSSRPFVAPRLGPRGRPRARRPVDGSPSWSDFVFAVVGAIGFAVRGGPPSVLTAGAFALIAALLNAAFGICLGCQLYPLVARFRRIPNPA